MIQHLSNQPTSLLSLDLPQLEQGFTPINIFTLEIRNLKAAISSLEKKVEVSFSGFTFKTLHNCKQFLTTAVHRRVVLQSTIA